MSPVEPLGGHTLTGRFIALEPLQTRHFDGLADAGRDPSIWTYMPHDVSAGSGAFVKWLAKENEAGRVFTFAVRRLSDDRLRGSASTHYIAPDYPREGYSAAR